MFVYVIVNIENLKLYIGKTKSDNLAYYLRRKFWEAAHARGRSHLFAAMRKYPTSVWSIHRLFESDNHEEICEHERLLIKALGAQHPDVGYNICRGGEGFTGLHSEETLCKMSASHKGHPTTEETRHKIRKSNLGKKRSKDTCRKLHETHLGKKHSEETRRKMSSSRNGHITTEETRRKIGNALLGIKRSEETRQKLHESHLGQIPWNKGVKTGSIKL